MIENGMTCPDQFGWRRRMGMNRTIALLTDLGNRDYFVGALKGAILSVNSAAKIVDITHEIPKYDVAGAAFTLSHAAKTFPQGAIFVVVVDPGVGTERKCVLLETKNRMSFVAPDNGVLTLVSKEFGVAAIFEIDNRKLMRPTISRTFHGRDIMAPVAAHLSRGVKAKEVGPRIKNIKLLELFQPRVTKDRITGHVVRVDDFGNLVTDVHKSLISDFATLGTDLVLSISNKKLTLRFAGTFGDVDPGEYLCYVDSADMLGLAKNRSDLAKELKVKIGAEFTIKRRGN